MLTRRQTSSANASNPANQTRFLPSMPNVLESWELSVSSARRSKNRDAHWRSNGCQVRPVQLPLLRAARSPPLQQRKQVPMHSVRHLVPGDVLAKASAIHLDLKPTPGSALLRACPSSMVGVGLQTKADFKSVWVSSLTLPSQLRTIHRCFLSTDPTRP
jgi:hypothetical protein